MIARVERFARWIGKDQERDARILEALEQLERPESNAVELDSDEGPEGWETREADGHVDGLRRFDPSRTDPRLVKLSCRLAAATGEAKIGRRRRRGKTAGDLGEHAFCLSACG
jgi:hypothetical protein